MPTTPKKSSGGSIGSQSPVSPPVKKAVTRFELAAQVGKAKENIDAIDKLYSEISSGIKGIVEQLAKVNAAIEKARLNVAADKTELKRAEELINGIKISLANAQNAQEVLAPQVTKVKQDKADIDTILANDKAKPDDFEKGVRDCANIGIVLKNFESILFLARKQLFTANEDLVHAKTHADYSTQPKTGKPSEQQRLATIKAAGAQKSIAPSPDPKKPTPPFV